MKGDYSVQLCEIIWRSHGYYLEMKSLATLQKEGAISPGVLIMTREWINKGTVESMAIAVVDEIVATCRVGAIPDGIYGLLNL